MIKKNNLGFVSALAAYVFALWFTSVFATDYYVAVDGSDVETGTQSRPWRTIQYAATVVTSGDRVILTDGIYPERVTITSNGTKDQPIVFKAENYVEGNLSNSVRVGGFLVKGNWVELHGFTLYGAGVPAYSGLLETGSSSGSHLLASDLKFAPSAGGREDNGSFLRCFYIRRPSPVTGAVLRRSTFEGFKYVVISTGGSDHLIEDCTIRGPGLPYSEGKYAETDAVRFFGSGHRFRRNVVRDFSGGGHVDLFQAFSKNGETSSKMLVERNTFIDCEAQIGMFSEAEGASRVYDWTFRNNLFIRVLHQCNIYGKEFKFYNNTFHQCTRNTGWPLLFRTRTNIGSGDGGQVYNNIFSECGSAPERNTLGWYHVEAGVTGFAANNNLVFGGAGNPLKVGLDESDGVNIGAPGFMDEANDDYRLAADSPGVGAGRAFPKLFVDDRAGTERVEPWDIGAWAFEQVRPGPPQGLRIIP